MPSEQDAAVPNSESPLTGPCPACHTLIDANFNYCPFCGQMIRLVCPDCRTHLEAEWSWCPTCGHNQAPPAVSIPTRVITNPLDGISARAADSNAEAFNHQGVKLYEAEQYDEAIEQFRRALAIEPTNSLYHCNLAVAYGEKGDAMAAFDEYQRALELNPADLTAHLNLGYYYNEREEFAKAQREWERVIDISPESAEADEARENLRHVDS